MPRGNKPLEITPAMIAEAYSLAKSCEYMETLADLLGVSKSTLYAAVRRGAREQRRLDKGLKPKADEDCYVNLAHAIKKGRAESEKANLELIQAAAQSGQWTAAAWRLERAHPQRWSLERGELRRLKKQVEELSKRINPKGATPDA